MGLFRSSLLSWAGPEPPRVHAVAPWYPGLSARLHGAQDERRRYRNPAEAAAGCAPGGEGIRIVGVEAQRLVEVLDRVGRLPQGAQRHSAAAKGTGVVRVKRKHGVEVPDRALVRSEIEMRDSPGIARAVAERLAFAALPARISPSEVRQIGGPRLTGDLAELLAPTLQLECDHDAAKQERHIGEVVAVNRK